MTKPATAEAIARFRDAIQPEIIEHVLTEKRNAILQEAAKLIEQKQTVEAYLSEYLEEPAPPVDDNEFDSEALKASYEEALAAHNTQLKAVTSTVTNIDTQIQELYWQLVQVDDRLTGAEPKINRKARRTKRT